MDQDQHQHTPVASTLFYELNERRHNNTYPNTTQFNEQHVNCTSFPNPPLAPPFYTGVNDKEVLMKMAYGDLYRPIKKKPKGRAIRGNNGNNREAVSDMENLIIFIVVAFTING